MPGTADLPWMRPLGAVPRAGGVEFRVWAPRAERVAVRIEGGGAPRELALVHAGHGVHEALLSARPGDDYRYVLDGAEAWPDPCSRFQPEGVRGPSRIVDLSAIAWTDDGWPGVPLAELVISELHVGTFSPDGTFDGAIPRLRELRGIGFTAIELMPVATFPGERNWGYDGLYTFAPHPAYGGPAGLARLVDAAHAAGLAVILDVVYNHVGPGAEALAAFGPYFTDRYGTFWGQAMNYDDADCEPVREWAIQNACMWARDYHIDALRLDAVHAIYDLGARHLLAEMADRVRRERPGALLIAESDQNDARLVRPPQAGGHGLDGQWADDFHHALHALLTAERDGYYADFGRVADLATAFERPYVYDGRWSPFRRRRHGGPPDGRSIQFVVCAQNHDQVGNRALGDRLPAAVRGVAVFCVLLSPYVPLLFMGEEYGEGRPFLFFTDHIDPEIAEATREGRRREFAAFAAFGEEVPDPQDPDTFERSRIAPGEGDPALRLLVQDLMRLRRRLGGAPASAAFDEAARWLRVRRGEHDLCINLGDAPVLVPTGGAEVVLATASAALGAGGVLLPPWSAVAVR